jgi:hypothetical protein
MVDRSIPLQHCSKKWLVGMLCQIQWPSPFWLMDSATKGYCLWNDDRGRCWAKCLHLQCLDGWILFK